MDGRGGVLYLKLKLIVKVVVQHSSVRGVGNQGSFRLHVLLFTDLIFELTYWSAAWREIGCGNL